MWSRQGRLIRSGWGGGFNEMPGKEAVLPREVGNRNARKNHLDVPTQFHSMPEDHEHHNPCFR